MTQLKKILSLTAFLFLFTVGSGYSQDLNANIRVAIKTGSSKGLINYFNSVVELKMDGKEGSYSKQQAEFVLKEFFRKYPCESFQYNHHGESPGGAKYSIGTYKYAEGTFRVYMKLKKVKKGDEDVYVIDTLDFSKE